MSKKVLRKCNYKFKKGDLTHLDAIYDVSGIGDGDGEWWGHAEENESDELIITRDIEFTITFYK